jgi:hypothetical protein
VRGSRGLAGILIFSPEEAWWRRVGIEDAREIGRGSSIVEVEVEDPWDTMGGACVIVVVGRRGRGGSTAPGPWCGGSHLVAYCD